jgi:hypothetical protein
MRELSPVASVYADADDGQRREAGSVPAAATTMSLLLFRFKAAWGRR